MNIIGPCKSDGCLKSVNFATKRKCYKALVSIRGKLIPRSFIAKKKFKTATMAIKYAGRLADRYNRSFTAMVKLLTVNPNPVELDPNDKIDPHQDCSHCDGGGKEYPYCDDCEGNGWVNDPSDGGTMTCPECNDEECGTCNGEGFINPDTNL